MLRSNNTIAHKRMNGGHMNGKQMNEECIKNEQCMVITGATGGIGQALCREFARRAQTSTGGAHKHPTFVLVGRNEAKLLNLAHELTNEYKVNTRVFVTDFAQTGAAETLIENIREADLDVQVLVNNAGFGYDAPFIESTMARQRELLHTNIDALVELCGAFAPAMAHNKRGAILNVASVAGFMPGPRLASYYASKAFVQSFTQALHVELFPYGVHVTALCPGPVNTDFWNNANAGNTALAHMTISASRVARSAVRALRVNKALCCPGVLAKSIVFGSRLLPRIGIARIAACLQKPS